ncbi:MAG: bifunctional riboflavin kinase/FAD synthetase [Acidobacteriota bacterium]
MHIIDGLNQFPKSLDFPVMAIGVFDGVHRGHQTIVERLVARAREKQGTCAILTFCPHPQKIISPADAPLLIQTVDQKEEMLDQLGVDLLVRMPFTRKLSLYSPEKFAREVLHNHGIREIHVGSNFRFGHRRSGNIETLRALGEELGFEIHEITPVTFRGQRISSTAIRMVLGQGRVAFARRLLGRPYQIVGTVVRGAGRGAQLGFPTANLNLENELIPATGVYATRAHLDGKSFPSLTNIGFRPTVELESAALPVVETHVLDYHENVYGKPMEVDFCLRLRAERKFDSVEALGRQIETDIQRTRKYLRRLKQLGKEEEQCPQ